MSLRSTVLLAVFAAFCSEFSAIRISFSTRVLGRSRLSEEKTAGDSLSCHCASQFSHQRPAKAVLNKHIFAKISRHPYIVNYAKMLLGHCRDGVAVAGPRPTGPTVWRSATPSPARVSTSAATGNSIGQRCTCHMSSETLPEGLTRGG